VALSFQIRGARAAFPAGSAGSGLGATGFRLDRVNSRELLRAARSVYFGFLEHGPGGGEPVGIVLVGDSEQGRVVFDQPVLLPEERFVPIEFLRLRGSLRTRGNRSPVPRTPA
jgi:hypothetical protein